jgi:hypothetical protein
LLDIQFLHDAIFNQHRIALRARAKADVRAVKCQSDCLGKFGVAIGQ